MDGRRARQRPPPVTFVQAPPLSRFVLPAEEPYGNATGRARIPD